MAREAGVVGTRYHAGTKTSPADWEGPPFLYCWAASLSRAVEVQEADLQVLQAYMSECSAIAQLSGSVNICEDKAS